MTKQKALAILGDSVSADGGLYDLGWYLRWNPTTSVACLDGDFDAEQLEAIAWYMRHAQENQKVERK